MVEKITDLEKFTLEQIFRPFQHKLGYGDVSFKELPIPLDDVPLFISKRIDTEWWKWVKDRIKKCGFYFPNYIKHSIIDLLRDVKQDSDK